MAVNDIFSVVFSHTVPNAKANPSVTHHFRQTGQVTPLVGNLLSADVIQAWVDTVITAYSNLIATNITLDTIDVVQVNNPVFGAINNIALAGVLALGGADLCSVRSSPVVSLRTGLRGRSFRGRSFFMTIPEVHNVGGVISAAFNVNMLAYMNGVLVITSIPSGNTYSLTVFSPTLSVPPVFVDNTVLSFIQNPKLGSQRKRMSVS